MDPNQVRNSAHSRVDTEPTDEDRRRAVRSVAGFARDADDCAMLLAALGLDPAEGRGRMTEVQPD